MSLKEPKIFEKIILVLIGLALALLVIELGFRLYDQSHPRTSLKFYDNDIFGSALVPSQNGLFVPHTKEYSTWVSVNSHGWPDVEHQYEKPVGVYRILILGDSFVENKQVPLEPRFFRQLQDKLGNKFEVIAVGRGNTGTAQQYLILKNYGLKYKPDLVIHMFFETNDVKNNSPILQNDPFLPYFELNSDGSLTELPHQKRSERKNENIKNLLKQLRTVEFILSVRQAIREEKANKKNGYPIDYRVYDNNYSEEYLKAWEVTKKLILETKREAEESGAKYMLIAFPGNEAVQKDVQERIMKTYPLFDLDKIDFAKPEKILSGLCQDNNVECRFMLPFFTDYINSNPKALLYNFYEGHWNQEGTNLAAEFLIETLSSLPEFDQIPESR